jgi:hypothetical protein
LLFIKYLYRGTDIAFLPPMLYVSPQFMVRKIYILTLLGVFFISTTGLPLTVSICNMGDVHTKDHCEMDMQKMANHSCCSKDKEESPVKISQMDMGSCCQLKVVDNNVTDKYLSLANESFSKTQISKLIVSNIISYVTEVFPSQNFYSSNSSPPLTDNHLYLTNSILLI